jgi:FkbM family methyltransferase
LRLQYFKPFVPPVVWEMVRAAVQRSRQREGIKEIDRLGLHWRLDMASTVAQQLADNGIWERDTTNLVRELVKPNMRVLTVGANFGYYTLLMAQQVGPGGHVYAFERATKFLDLLKWNVAANKLLDRVTICPFGLSDSTIRTTISFDASSASIRTPPNAQIVGNETIELRPLDELASHLGLDKIDFVLVDVDGHEPAFLKGARRTLERDTPTTILEIMPEYLYFAGSSALEVAELLPAGAAMSLVWNYAVTSTLTWQAR